MKYAFCGGKLLDGTREMQPREGLVLRTDGDRITDIVPEGTDLTGYEVVDLKGGYLMPGLINLHVHLAGNGKPQKKQRDNEKLVKTILSTGLTRKVAYGMVAGFAKDELFSGVTTIRTVGGLADFDTRLRDDIRAGRRVGPRILAANEGISVPGGHMAGSVAVAAHTIDEALAQLEKGRQQGVDLVKLMITGGVLDAKEKGVPGELKMPPEMVKAGGYDAVISAVGAEPVIPPVPGIDGENVINALTILDCHPEIGRKVVVVGGGMIGTETAIDLAEKGHEVTIVEMKDAIMADCAVTDIIAYYEKIGINRIAVIPGLRVTEVTDQGVRGVNDRTGSRTELPADSVVIAVGLKPRHAFYDTLAGEPDLEVYEIGDCVKAGKILDAFHTAYKTAVRI